VSFGRPVAASLARCGQFVPLRITDALSFLEQLVLDVQCVAGCAEQLGDNMEIKEIMIICIESRD
jgi:hypothetical protein